MSKSSLLKNARNYAEYLRKKERGPVKAFFHITKNENVPAIEQQGLLTNHPNANINSANHPFRKHGTDAGGVWVTTEPTAFPVYGTTIGGKNGNAAARADALSTIKIEVPLPELGKMKAVQDPYGKNILRKGDDPRAVEKFGTWAGIDVPTTVFLDDIKPSWLKNIGYVEEAPNAFSAATDPEISSLAGSWELSLDDIRRMLNKSDFRDYSGYTGHRHGAGSYEKSPERHVTDYIDSNRPITERSPILPEPDDLDEAARIQGSKKHPEDVQDAKRYSAGFIPAKYWTDDYREYVKPGESINSRRYPEFAPGAISRGIGGADMPSIKDRNFNWNKYKRLLEEGDTPQAAAFAARPKTQLDWDNIVFTWNGGYVPHERHAVGYDNLNEGAISRGMGHLNRPAKVDLQKRHFNWNTYLEHLNRGYGPDEAAYYAAPEYVLDWDNIVYTPKMGYTPKKVEFRSGKPSFNSGHVSNAADYGNYLADSEGNEMLAGDESLLKIKKLLDMNGPKFYTDEMNLLSDGRPVKTIKDMEHPTWQETLRALMKLRYLEQE